MKFDMFMVDLDGVLADFDAGVKAITGGLPHEIHKRDMWKAITSKKNFFEELALTHDALELWAYLNNTGKQITILTGLPTMNDGAEQKRRWVKKHFGDVPCIVLPSKDKRLHAAPNRILIDDRHDMINGWLEAKGYAILHTSTESTIQQLSSIGF